MKKWIKYGLINAVIGFIIGGAVATFAIGNGYYIFALAAPLAAFITGAFFWSAINKKPENYSTGRIILTGFLTGTVSHYITFILLSVGENICYWTTGGCTASLGGPPVSVLSMSTAAFAFCFFSLLFFGWLTVLLSVVAGFLVKTKNEPTRRPF
ncbi:hypothetical protein GZH53_00795 [Flavihumibacter sp. R14]|nr:hypothetical protein [Flavihumibacter soli]